MTGIYKLIVHISYSILCKHRFDDKIAGVKMSIKEIYDEKFKTFVKNINTYVIEGETYALVL